MPWNQPTPAPPNADSGFDRKVKWILPLVIGTVLVGTIAAAYLLTPLIQSNICLTATTIPDTTMCSKVAKSTWVPQQRRREVLGKLASLSLDAEDYGDAIAGYDRMETMGALSVDEIRNRGHAYYYTGKLTEAAADYSNALALKSNDADILADLIYTQLKEFKYDQARKSAAHFLTNNPHSATAYMLAARAAYFDDENAAAIPLARRAITEDPNYADAYNMLALIFEDEGRDEQALANYDSAIKLSPDDSAFISNRARLQRDSGNWQDAITDFKRAIELSETSDNFLGFAEAQMNGNDYGAARKSIDKAFELDPKSTAAYLIEERFHSDQNDYVSARKSVAKALAMDPELANAKYRLALLDRSEGKYEAAIASFETLQGNWPRSAMPQVDAGHSYLELGKITEAMAAFDRGLTINPKSADAYDGKARASLQSKDWQAAVDYASTAIQLQRDGAFYARRAYGEWALRDIEKAARDYDDAILLSPSSRWIVDERLQFMSWDGDLEIAEAEVNARLAKPEPEGAIYRAAGHIADRKKDSAAAVAHYEKALKMLPNDGWLLEDIAWASMDNNQPVQARDYCEKMISILTDAPESYRCHARTLYTLNDTGAAIVDLTNSLRLDNQYKAARFDRGYMYLADGKNEEAIDDFKMLINADYRMADCHYYLGLAQQNLGNERAAIKSFETSLATATDQLARDVNHQLNVLRGKQPGAAQNKLRLYPQVRPHGLSDNTLPLPSLGTTSTR
jgi:tetratricopeptide (TPR) repeat protein